MKISIGKCIKLGNALKSTNSTAQSIDKIQNQYYLFYEIISDSKTLLFFEETK
jgi:hypothetical protein